MKAIRKRSLVLLGAAAAVLVLAGAAIAAGPPGWAPGLGQHAGQGNGQMAGQGNGLAGGHQGYGLMAGGVVMDTAADYLGISETALATARHDGASLAQIAVDNGKTAAGLQQAIVAAYDARVEAAVSAGTITSAQAEQLRTGFEAQVQTMLNQTATGPISGRGSGAGAGAGLGAGLGLGPCGGVNR